MKIVAGQPYVMTCLVNDLGQPVVQDFGTYDSCIDAPRVLSVEVVSPAEYERRFLPLAHAQAPVKRLQGYEARWSLYHVDHSETGWDLAIVPHLERLHVLGYRTSSSCQGGWFPWADGPVVPQDAQRGVYEDGVLWFRKRPHVFLDMGPGYGSSGVARGAKACQRLGLDTVNAERECKTFAEMAPRIAADALNLYVILEGPSMSDVRARAWWDRVVALAQGWSQ